MEYNIYKMRRFIIVSAIAVLTTLTLFSFSRFIVREVVGLWKGVSANVTMLEEYVDRLKYMEYNYNVLTQGDWERKFFLERRCVEEAVKMVHNMKRLGQLDI